VLEIPKILILSVKMKIIFNIDVDVFKQCNSLILCSN